MLPIASFAGDFATAVGVVAGMIAIGGFIGHAPSVLGGAPDREIQEATASGGIIGGSFGLLVVVLSAITSRVFL
jgi:hypothetical protein